MLTDSKRIVKSGFLNFWRNGFVSLASVLVITITLFVFGSLIFFSAILNTSLAQIESKVDVDVYFATDAPEDKILDLKVSLEELPEVASVSYTSREQALAQFEERHADDFLTLQALEELEENPLGASLNISAVEASQYESIARFLEGQNALIEGEESIIDTINYYQNKTAIENLASIINATERLGLIIVLTLALIAIVITLNTIRLAIYTSREEIAVMRLVGANKKYVQGPFIVEGFISGALSAIAALAIFYPLTLWVGGATENFFGGINVYEYYLRNFWQLFAVLLASGVVLGMFSSYLAVRRYIRKKYLKV